MAIGLGLGFGLGFGLGLGLGLGLAPGTFGTGMPAGRGSVAPAAPPAARKLLLLPELLGICEARMLPSPG